MMQLALWIKHACEYLGGAEDQPPEGFPMSPRSLLWGIWWGLLVCLIIAFCGHSSKFIYIDF